MTRYLLLGTVMAAGLLTGGGGKPAPNRWATLRSVIVPDTHRCGQ